MFLIKYLAIDDMWLLYFNVSATYIIISLVSTYLLKFYVCVNSWVSGCDKIRDNKMLEIPLLIMWIYK